MATANSTPQMLGTQALDSQEYRDRLSKTLGTSAPVTPVSTVSNPTVVTPVAPSTPVVPTTPVTPTQNTGSYTVVQGDSLSKIASSNKMTLQQLLDLNPTYKANPNLVQIGAKLNLATASPTNPVTPVPTPQNPTPAVPTKTPQQMSDDSLALEAGKAGLSLDQYKSLLESKNTVTKEESDSIARELGITALEGELFKKPSQSSQQLFDSAYASAGLADLKNKIAEYDRKIAIERANLAEAVAEIDANPFLIESSRVGRGKRVLDQAEKRISNLLSEKEGYANLYNNGIKEIEGIVTRNREDFASNQQVNTAQLNYLLKKAETQTQLLKDKKTSDSIKSVSTFLSSKTPEVIGNSTSGYFTYDPTTGKFVQVTSGKTTTPKTTTPPSEKIVSGTLTYTAQDQAEDSKALEDSRGSDGYVDPTIYQNLYKAWVGNGGVLKDFLTKFPPKNYVNPANDWLPEYLMPTTTTKKTSTGKTTINDL